MDILNPILAAPSLLTLLLTDRVKFLGRRKVNATIAIAEETGTHAQVAAATSNERIGRETHHP